MDIIMQHAPSYIVSFIVIAFMCLTVMLAEWMENTFPEAIHQHHLLICFTRISSCFQEYLQFFYEGGKALNV